MEAKYGGQVSRDEPNEAEFEAAAARIGSKKQNKAKQKENQATNGLSKKKKQRQN